MDEQSVRYIGKWLNDWAQRVVISGAKSAWMPATSAVPQRAILVPALFNNLINNTDLGVECTFVMI